MAVGWVLVPVVVRSRSGYVENLSREDFQVFVDNRPIRFESFERRGEAPVSLVFLQDLSGSMETAGKLRASQQAARYFINLFGQPGDEIALASFAGARTQVEVPFTNHRQALEEGVGAWEAYGTTALHDAVAWLPEISIEGRNPKRSAVLVTDGADNASKIPPAAARELVRQAEVPVYVLGLGSGDPFAVRQDGTDPFLYADLLNLLATMSGGRYYPITGPDELKEACAEIADELRHQYVLSFSTRAEGAVRYRPIRVAVKGKKDLRILTRQGYEGTPPS